MIIYRQLMLWKKHTGKISDYNYVLFLLKAFNTEKGSLPAECIAWYCMQACSTSRKRACILIAIPYNLKNLRYYASFLIMKFLHFQNFKACSSWWEGMNKDEWARRERENYKISLNSCWGKVIAPQEFNGYVIL